MLHLTGQLGRFLRRLARRERASAIVEFALVIPVFFMVVWAAITFGRAYQRLNTLSASLREGARYAATRQFPYSSQVRDQIKGRVYDFSVAYGHPIDTSRVVVDETSGFDVHVRVTNYPLFSGLNFIGNLAAITINRDAVFRLEGS